MPARATTYTVTDYGDSGTGTLCALVAAQDGDTMQVLNNSGMQNTITLFSPITPTANNINITVGGDANTHESCLRTHIHVQTCGIAGYLAACGENKRAG